MELSYAPSDYRAFFAEVFAELDARPRKMKVKVFGDGLVVDMREGNPVFSASGETARADYRRRWIAEHPVPVTLGRASVFTFVPTSGNRVKVRIK
ncbi:MAG: hypothetical protein IJ829_02755 [Kiritimatiellae bacterium]|nr:hypothetical protein [Kiritimatiellia bacterium]